MNRLSFILALLWLAATGYAQENYTQEPGRVTQYEMSMTEYPSDPDAEAVVLYDLGNYYFQGDDHDGFVLFMNRRTKIKILKQSGTGYANFEIPYYSEGERWESVQSIEAVTYNVEGGLSKTALEPKNIYEEKVNDHVRIKKIAMPNVREGSVVELAYTIRTPFYFNMRQWYFQRKIPVVYSRLIYKAIPYYAYTYILKGTNRFDEFTSNDESREIRFGNLTYRERVFHFGLKNIPAFKDEEYITSEENHIISLNFQMSEIYYPRGGNKKIMTTWPQMCEDFCKDDDFGKYVKNAEKEAKKILPGLGLEGKNPGEQAEIITAYVKSEYKWNGRYGKFSEVKLKDFMTQRSGNAGNINLFLVGLLKAAGLDAEPVILSTRQNGEISDSHPFQQFFNYVIGMVKTEEKIFLIDGTEPLLHFSDIPERCINVKGLVIKPKAEEWIITKQKMNSNYQRHYTLTILPEENRAEVDATYINIGDAAYRMRSVCLDKDENLVKYLKDKNNIDCKDLKVAPLKKLDRPFAFSFRFSSGIEANAGKLFIQPFCNLAISNNPFKQTSRTLPVDLIYHLGETYNSTVNIPEGYKVEHLPSPVDVDNDLMTIRYAAYGGEGRVSVSASYNLKQSLYEAGDYERLKAGFNDIIKQFSEMIVLVKE